MSRDALQQRLTVYAATAGRSCPSLASKNITPQLRHTAGTVLINRDVPQHVVQKILDHDSP
jgi:integrase/recombinase XerD